MPAVVKQQRVVFYQADVVLALAFFADFARLIRFGLRRVFPLVPRPILPLFVR